MQDSRVIVPPMGQDIPKRVVSEPVSVPWVAIRKTVNALAYPHHLRIRLACEKRRLVRIGFIRLLNGRAVIGSTEGGDVVCLSGAFPGADAARIRLTLPLARSVKFPRSR